MRIDSKRLIGPCIAFLLCAAGRGAIAADDDFFPAKARVALLFIALTYDQQLLTRCADGIHIAVLSNPSDEASKQDASEVLSAIASYRGKKIKGLAITVERIGVASPQEAARLLAEGRSNIVYLSTGTGSFLKSILEFALTSKALVIASEKKLLTQGASMAVVLRSGKPKVLVNLKALREQGVDFDSSFLRLVEYVLPQAD